MSAGFDADATGKLNTDAHASDARWRLGVRPEGSERQGFEVLYDCCEVEFVTCTGKSSEPHAFKAVMNLEVSKTHLDALSFIP